MAQMFSIGDNGELTYSESIVQDGSLFGDEMDPDLVLDDMETINQVAASSDPDVILEEGIIEGQTSDLGEAPSGDVITYNVYAIPSDTTGYPNANSLSYLEDVVKGYPIDYDYVCYRTDSQYAQSMILYVGKNASLNGSTVHFDYCDIIELDYRYENYNNSWLDRNYYIDSDVNITLNQETLAYTNVLPGYATFDTTMEDSKAGLLLAGGILVAAFSFVIIRILGGISHV